MPEAPIRLLLADVDGTLVTRDKILTDRAVEAVRALGRKGVLFAVTSGRPPRGMSMLAGPLGLTTPIAAFNGGVLTRRDLSVVSQKSIPAGLVAPVVALLDAYALDVWLYRNIDWYVRDPAGPHVDRESRTVRFAPTPVDDYAGLSDGVAKVVGVSDDHEAVAAAEQAARSRFADHVSAARSQPYYLDVTHPEANKGRVAQFLADHYSIPPSQIATIGDMPNDVLMFAHSGLSIAMGNADPQVQRAARHVTTSNEEEGFAHAVEQFVLRERSS
ncbi:HAD family phosphatase [Streptomyces sp. MUM 203J]|uniref:Cof-type HAD-IIB family hydrolase n=1 Tax=Streptomyces sp. MUM 203J TaxID=2791990 RepID=UPI001F03D580|nr:Cof-type HAD-IIB family hydrolase [Streptomyces sp. MUM 203J]MCH0540356.1 HAD family phosphatase [Streptomyces sp. MUM 203J]